MNNIYGKEILVCLWSADSRSIVEEVLKDFVEKVSEPVPAVDEDGNEIPDVFQPRILEPMIIYLDDGYEELALRDGEENDLVQWEPQQIQSISQRETIARRSTTVSVKSSKASTRGISIGSSFVDRESHVTVVDDGRPKLIIPPVWTPANQPGNAIFMYTFFKKVNLDTS